MPRIALFGAKKPPEGWDEIAPELEEFKSRMRDAVNEPHEGKRKKEVNWPIIKIHYERSRYIYELYYKQKAISKELYDWLLKEKWGDAALIAKWKKPGYEFLCSLQAIDKTSTNFGTTSLCRVPLHLRKPGPQGPNANTGCISCASFEASRMNGPLWWDAPRPADLVGWAKAGCPTADKPARKRKDRGDDIDPDLEARAKLLRSQGPAGAGELAEIEKGMAALRGNQAGGGGHDEPPGGVPTPPGSPASGRDDDEDSITGDEGPKPAKP